MRRKVQASAADKQAGQDDQACLGSHLAQSHMRHIRLHTRHIRLIIVPFTWLSLLPEAQALLSTTERSYIANCKCKH